MTRAKKAIGPTAEEWNKLYPVGTPVRFTPVRGQIYTENSKTRSEAWALGHGEVVVAIEGRSGGVAISHLQVLLDP